MITALLIISVFFNILFIYLLYNTLNKLEKLEDYASEFLSDLTSLKEKIAAANLVMKQADNLGAFESDDEVGTAFKIIKDCLEQLDPETVHREDYGKN